VLPLRVASSPLPSNSQAATMPAGAAQRPPLPPACRAQFPKMQSVSTMQRLVTPQLLQLGPPQSRSVSAPSWIPLLHALFAGTQTPA